MLRDTAGQAGAEDRPRPRRVAHLSAVSDHLTAHEQPDGGHGPDRTRRSEAPEAPEAAESPEAPTEHDGS